MLANCEPRVLCKTVLLHPRTGEQIRIDVELSFVLTREGKERHITHIVDMAKLDKMKLSEIDVDLYTASDKNFVAYIKSLVPEAPTAEKYSIDSLGWVNIDGHYFYNVGNRFIGDTENISLQIACDDMDISLDANANITEEDAFESVWQIFGECGMKLRLVMIYVFGSVLRQLFKDADYVPRTTVYLVAKTQSGKTTFVQGIGCPFVSDNGDIPNYTRVSSTKAVTEEAISRFKDMLYIYDDVYVDDKRIRTAIEERVKGILRNSADNAPRRKIGADNQVNAQLLLIGENLISGISNLGRLLIIHLPDKLSSTLLSTVHQYRGHIGAFYSNYIDWIANNYNSVVDMIKCELERFYRIQKGSISRDFDTQFFMMCCTKIFCFYAQDKGFITEQQKENTVKGINKDLVVVLEENHQIFAEAKLRDEANKAANYSKILLTCLEEDYLCLSKKGSDFFEHSCKGEKCYFIRCEYFSGILFQYFRRKVSAKALADYFRKRDIGIFENNGRLRQYKPNRKRYLVLKKKALRNDARDNLDIFDALFG